MLADNCLKAPASPIPANFAPATLLFMAVVAVVDPLVTLSLLPKLTRFRDVSVLSMPPQAVSATTAPTMVIGVLASKVVVAFSPMRLGFRPIAKWPTLWLRWLPSNFVKLAWPTPWHWLPIVKILCERPSTIASLRRKKMSTIMEKEARKLLVKAIFPPSILPPCPTKSE